MKIKRLFGDNPFEIILYTEKRKWLCIINEENKETFNEEIKHHIRRTQEALKIINQHTNKNITRNIFVIELDDGDPEIDSRERLVQIFLAEEPKESELNTLSKRLTEYTNENIGWCYSDIAEVATNFFKKRGYTVLNVSYREIYY